MIKNKNIMIIVAHPDDEILGCGGTIAKLAPNNYINAVILINAITSREIKPSKAEVEEATQNTLNAQKLIGIQECFFENFPDNRLDELTLLDIVKKVQKYIDDINPDIIFTHHHSDLNIDHRITFQAVLTCCRPQPNFKHPDIYCFEVPSSTEWQVLTGENIFKPNVYIDISNTMEQKLKALEQYKSEMKEYPHSRSLEGVKIMAQDWGRKIGREFVEAFELIRSVRDNL